MNFMAIGLLASVGRRNVEGVKQVGTAELCHLYVRKRKADSNRLLQRVLKKRKCLVHLDRERLKSLLADDLGLNVDI